VFGWLADVFRGAWGLWYWNIRKTVFRLRRGQGTCPCQNPSDSGEAGRTGCDAALGWHRPARFRHVCPLMRQEADGRVVCSVAAAQVRPFWGRALAWQAGTLGTLALLAALLVFGLLRQVGYGVQFTDVAWPPHWSRINPARAVFFFEQATTALQAGETTTAVSALQLAQRLDPDHADSAMLLAQLWQATRPDASNLLYLRLIETRPDLAPQLAQLWYRTLLGRDDQTKIEQLAAHRLRHGDPETTVWLQAYLHANQRTRNLEHLRTLREDERLPRPARVVLTLEWEVRTATLPRQGAQLLREVPAHSVPTPFEVVYRVRRLIALGNPAAAFDVATIYGVDLSDRDRVALLLDAQAARGDETGRRNLIGRILRAGVDGPALEVLAAHLIRHPSPNLYLQCRDHLRRAVAADPRALLPTMFAVAGIHQDNDALQHLIEMAHTAGSLPPGALVTAANFLLNPRSRNVGTILPILRPIGLDVTYALLEHYETRP
jgi:tetratricopeptide (TPR) repeat protein